MRIPDLVAIDGFVGMEGKGPLFGDPIEVGGGYSQYGLHRCRPDRDWTSWGMILIP